jgi:hypothetical protein
MTTILDEMGRGDRVEIAQAHLSQFARGRRAALESKLV